MSSLEGSVDEIDLVQRLVELGREQFTGAIRFEQDGIIKIVYFKGGDVLSASTNDRKDAVDEILLRAGKVGREHVKQALANRKETETLGDALLNLGFITRKELTWARRVQVIGILRSVRAWTNGTYAIVPDYLPKREEGTLFPLAQIIVEFIVTEQDRQTFDRAMDGGEVVLLKTDEFDRSFEKLGLNDDAIAIVSEIDGMKSAAEIASATGAETFNVYKLLEALRMLGLLERAGAKVQVSDELDFASAGVSDAADSWSDPAPQVSLEPEPQSDFGAPMSFTPEPDEQPASGLPPQAAEPMSFSDPEPEAVPAAAEPAAAPDANTPAMPQWKFEEERKIPFALSLDSRSTASAEEPTWGFDEAQIEAAERAAAADPNGPPMAMPAGVPMPMKETPSSVPLSDRKRMNLPQARPKPAKKSFGTAFGLIVSLLLAAIIAGVYMWWRARSAPPAPVIATTTNTRPVLRPTTTATTTQPEMIDATTMGSAAAAAAAAPESTATQPATSTTPPPSTLTLATTPAPRPTSATSPTATAAPPMTPARTTTAPTVASRLEKSTTGRVITNTSTPAETDNDRERYDALARQHAKNATGNYTIQFELVCQTPSVAKAVAAGGSNVWFVPTQYRGQSCYRVFWGKFDTRDAAVAAVSRIPAQLKGSAPVVVSVPK
jgi:hypothetical protein